MFWHYFSTIYVWCGITIAISMLVMAVIFVVTDHKYVVPPDDKAPWWIIPVAGIIGLLFWPAIICVAFYYEAKEMKEHHETKKQKDKIHGDLCAWLEMQTQHPNNALIPNVSSEVYRVACDILEALDYAPEFAAPTFRNSIQYEWGGDDKPYMEFEIFDDRVEIFVLRPKGIMAQNLYEARDHSFSRTVANLDYRFMNHMVHAYKDGLYNDDDDYTATDINEE